MGLGHGDEDGDLRVGLGAVVVLGLEDKVLAVVLLGSSGLWWGVLAPSLDLDDYLCGILVM